MRLKEACRGFDDVREGLKAFDKSGDGQLDGDELKRMIRVDLRITDADLKDSDVAAFLRVVDEDGSGFVSVDELADFVVHGISHFYNDEALDGKNLALPLPVQINQ